MFFQAAIDQLLAPETLDRIVDILANGDFCAAFGDERCPAAVDVVIRQGLPTNIKIPNIICNIIYNNRDFPSSQRRAPRQALQRYQP